MPEGSLCHGKTWSDRPGEGRGQRGSPLWRPLECDLPWFCAHAAGGQADSRAGPGARNIRGRCRQESYG